MKQKIIIGIVSLTVIIIALIAILSKDEKNIELTTFKASYNMVQTSTDEAIEVAIFIDRENTYIVKKDNIVSTAIKDDNDIFALKLTDIINTKEELLLKNKVFYKYLFILKPNIEIDSSFSLEIKDAILELNYKQENIQLEIGSFSYYNYNYNEIDLGLSKLKGLVNEISSTKTLVGTLFNFKNNTNSLITITKIKALDINIELSISDAIKINDFNQGTLINDLLGHNYNTLFTESTSSNMNEEINNELSIFIPYKYKDNVVVNKIGFLVEYESDGIIKHFVIDDFLFFESSVFTEADFNNLKYYLYPNG